MPQIEFTVDNTTGETSMKIKGVKGKGCKPIHAAFSADLKASLGLDELSSSDTPEMNETAERNAVANAQRLAQS